MLLAEALSNCLLCLLLPSLSIHSTATDPAAILNITPPAIQNLTPSAILNSTPNCYPKPKLKLPKTQEEWEEVNNYFSQVLVPQVVNEASPDTKNARLTDGIYTFLATNYGTRDNPRKKKRQAKLASALNKAKNLKNEARRQLRQAKYSGSESPEQIMTLARKFYQLVRAHSRCKRANERAKDSRATRQARQECHRHFWPFAKRLLNSSLQSDTEPQFSQEVAAQFFKNTYHAEETSFVTPQ